MEAGEKEAQQPSCGEAVWPGHGSVTPAAVATGFTVEFQSLHHHRATYSSVKPLGRSLCFAGSVHLPMRWLPRNGEKEDQRGSPGRREVRPSPYNETKFNKGLSQNSKEVAWWTSKC